MKREEAIKLIDTHTVCFYNEIDSPTLQALHMAIEALSEPINCVKCKHYYETEDGTDVYGHCRMDTAHTISKEEAIHELQEDKRLYETEVCHAGDGSPDGRLLEALDMAIEALSADADGEDLIIKGAKGIQDGLYNIKDGKLFKYKAKGGTVRTYPIVPSAEAEPIVIRSRTLMPTKDFKAWARRIRETNPNAVVIPCDAEVVSPDAVQGEWIEVEDYNGDVHYKCDQCGEEWTFPFGTPKENNANFCPNCGARMKGGGDK